MDNDLEEMQALFDMTHFAVFRHTRVCSHLLTYI